MRRSQILLAVLAVLASVYAARLLPRGFRAHSAQPAKRPPLVWQPTAAQALISPPRGSAQPDRLTADAPQAMLIPTEIPPDSVNLLPNFTPPVAIRMLAGAEDAHDVLWAAQVAD